MAVQLESLRETVTKMRSELMSLRSDNVRLQHTKTTSGSGGSGGSRDSDLKSIDSSHSSLHLAADSSGKRYVVN